jgi:hypothetical protein
MERATRVLYGAAATLFLAGLAVRLMPAPLPASQSAERGLASQSSGVARVAPAERGADSTIVSGNIFSLSRSAPAVRYTPPDLAAPAPAARPRAVRSGTPGLRLLGTVSGTAALVDANPEIPGAEIYQIGDVIRGKRLVAVLDSSAVLEGPTGRTVLRLEQHKPSTP